MRTSGYFGSPTVHAIRRYLGKKLNGKFREMTSGDRESLLMDYLEKYTETERSQHITQNDPRVYGQSYVANTSSCDGRRVFLNEVVQHDHVEYFQGFGKFCEKGLPCALPAEKEAALEKDQQLIELDNKIKQLEIEGASAKDVEEARYKASNYHKILKKASLQEYQTWWVQNRRDWKIRTQGEQTEDFTPTELVQALSMIIPERGRLTEMMISDKVVSELERKQAITDIHSFITRDYTVLYRTGEELINGTCPVKDCDMKIER